MVRLTYCLNCPSLIVRLMSVSPTGHDGLSRTEREPQIHKTSDLTNEKLSLVLMKHVASPPMSIIMTSVGFTGCDASFHCKLLR